MGITIYSKNVSHDLGSGGFYRLRKTIAGLCPDEIKNHYMLLADIFCCAVIPKFGSKFNVGSCTLNPAISG